MRRTMGAPAKAFEQGCKPDYIKEFELFCMCGLIPLCESGILRTFWRG
ncbi:MAG: hypothetical protein AW07_03700 [Candidatus Accumulibacter sp. SK-11]|nr:MAG: hypothetical protein AW07_03700 [Candidatus Accumulibacter sp. SK-11]